MNEVASEKEKLALKIAKLEMRGRLIREKERKLLTKQLIGFGDLIVKSGIDSLERDTLLGAFLEIKELMHNSEQVKNWKKISHAFLQSDIATNPQQLIIKFSSEPSSDIKLGLRERKFRWNQFRSEWYGYGKMEELQEFLKEENANVELVNPEK